MLRGNENFYVAYYAPQLHTRTKYPACLKNPRSWAFGIEGLSNFGVGNTGSPFFDPHGGIVL